MAIQVQSIIQQAAEQCSLTRPGTSVSGNVSTMALYLFNNLLSELNNQQLIVPAINDKELTVTGSVGIVDEGVTPPSGYVAVSGEVPDRLLGVSRKIGDRWVQLHSCTRQQMAQRNPMQLPTSWSYEITNGNNTDLGGDAMWGVLYVDSNRPTQIKFWYPSKLKADNLSDTIYISDMYTDMILQGLCLKLSDWAKTYDYSERFEKAFRVAKSLVKRSNQTQRMLQTGDLVGGYDDNFYNGKAGFGW